MNKMRKEDRFISELNKKKDHAWKELYRNFYPALCAYACRITRQEHGVEDIVQECLIHLWTSDLKFPEIRALAAYLYRAVYTRSLNSLRDQTNAHRILHSLDYTQEGPDEDTAIDIAIEEIVVTRFRLILSELPQQQSKILQLSMEGLKVREIAKQLGVTENTIKMQKKRAYAEIREGMGKVWSILLIDFFPNIFKNI